jgi:hypothetical protein
MRRFLILVVISSFLAVTQSVSVATAGPMLSVAADSADPSNLSVGQVVQFDVSLSGLGAGDSLDYLAGTVVFPTSLLGTPSNVSAGAIVPDPSGFMSAGFAGSADAFYDAVFFSNTHTPITTNGIFFTFDVTAQAPGSGNLAFDPTTLAANDGSNNPITLDAGPPLPFDIHGTASTPEPASLVLLLSGLCAMVAARGCPAMLGAKRR